MILICIKIQSSRVNMKLNFMAKASLLIISLATFVALAKANNVAKCNDSPLDVVEGGMWICNPDPIVYGTMCVLDCTDPLSIPEGDYEVTCTPEGWFPNPSQVSTIFCLD